MDGLADEVENTIASPTRDPTYFLQCDCIVLKVENTLFSIPRFQLLKYSQPLRSLPPLSSQGSSEENPFLVNPEISVNEFRHFLRIILPSVTENLESFWTNSNPADSVSKEEWISVLKISTLWRSGLSLRNLAISKLEGLALNGVEMIILGRRYFIARWVEAGYVKLVENREISDEQMDAIGAVESFKLTRIAVLEVLGYPRYNKIKETFQAELHSIAEEAQAREYELMIFY